jgi:hypothetical protein
MRFAWPCALAAGAYLVTALIIALVGHRRSEEGLAP